MAGWTPQDGTHGQQAGAPDLYCFKCSQFCGGTDAGGSPLVCNHCRGLGLPPAGDAAVAESRPLLPDQGPGGTGAGEPFAVTTSPAGPGTQRDEVSPALAEVPPAEPLI
jgi:hypothetical protein